MNTKFVNNLPAYWGKYVTNVKQNMDISTTPYVQIYTHLKAYEPHAKKTLKKQEQSTMDTKAVSPTNNQLRTSSNSRTHATVHDGLLKKTKIVTEQFKEAPCKEPKIQMDFQYFKDKALLMELKKKANHEDAYDSDVDEGPNAAVAFMANLSSTNSEDAPEEHLDSDAETEIDDNTIPRTYLEIRRIGFLPTKLLVKLGNHLAATPLSKKVDFQVKFLDILRNIFDELEAEYEQCVLDNKNLTIEKKNLLIKNDCLIAECLEKDICSIVLTSDIVVPPSSNCLCEDLRSACDREHTKVLELEAEVFKQQKMVIESEKRNSHLQKNHIDLQLKFQNYKQCIDTSSASNAIFEINKLRQQLQGKDDTIRNLDAQINIMKVLNVGSTEGSCDQQALETDRIQLKDTITSLRIQLDGLKVENVSLKRRYDELSKANTHSRTAYTEKLSAFTAENTKLKAQVTGKTSSGPSTSEKPKVLASGMYTNSSKYIPPPKRANWVKPTPLPKKKQVTFQEPPRTSNRPTQKPPVQQNKKPNVPVNLSTRTKPATESRKPMPKSHTRNHRILPSKSVNARRAADHNRKLNVVDHNQFMIRSLKNHNVNTTKTAWRPTRKVVGSVKPQWKPTGRHFALYDNCPLTRIMEPIVEPLELTPSVSSSSKVTMISRFTDCKLSDRKAGSKGISGYWDEGVDMRSKNGPKRVAMKIDIQKAHDTVNWTFLEAILNGFWFHMKMVNWIIKCVSTTTFSIYVNGESFGYFKGGRSLRQGDPMPPYLFTLIMEILNLIVQDKVECSEDFQYHFGCKRMKTTQGCFADDLTMFCHGNCKFVSVLKDVIDEFGAILGLLPNYTKSTIIFGSSMKDLEKDNILEGVPFKVEKLPMKY
ncbi:putative reverse transcriptase domain-containing protein [Tanacetum coccineum]